MIRHSKRPRAPRHPLVIGEEDIRHYSGVLWRIHRTRGDYVLGWDKLRTWGPAANCRWEPHPPSAAEHPGEGVMYASVDLATAVVEMFQDTRRVDPHTGAPRATSWTPTRPLRLLDLTDDWLLRMDASFALASASRATCRTWARAVRVAFADLDGLWTASTLTGRGNVTLWAPAAGTFPDLPGFSEPLAGDLMWDLLDRIAHRYRRAGYRML